MKCLAARFRIYWDQEALPPWALRHISACPACSSVLDTLRGLQSALRAAPRPPAMPRPLPPAALRGPETRPVPFFSWAPQRAVLVAAALALAAFCWMPVSGWMQRQRLVRTIQRGNARLAGLVEQFPAASALSLAEEIDLLTADVRRATLFLFDQLPLDYAVGTAIAPSPVIR